MTPRTASRSALIRLSASAFAFALAGLAGGAAPAAADPDGWRAVPAVPELHVRFEDSEHGAPCAPLGTTPTPAAVECWAAYVDRAVSKRSSPLTTEINLACVAKWEDTGPGQGGCPGDAARCVRPALGIFERVPEDLPIDTNISATWALATDLAREYTAFQTLRSGHALNPHRPRIAGLAVSQGMLVLYRAYAITALRRQLEAETCGRDHLQPYFDLARQVTQELGGSDVPEILDSYPAPGQLWARRFYRVQLEVLGRADGIRPAQDWKQDCEKAAEVGRRVGRLDADLNVWCGYAYELLGQSDEAFIHWQLARRSPNHPEASSFAKRRLEVEGRAAAKTAQTAKTAENAAEVRP